MNKKTMITVTAAVFALLLTTACSKADQGKDKSVTQAATAVQKAEAQETVLPAEEAAGEAIVDDSETEDASAQAGSSDDAAAAGEGKLGDTLDYHGLAVTVDAVRETDGDDFLKPKARSTYKIIEITVENKGDEKKVISSMLSFRLTDADGVNYMSVITSDVKQSLDGEVAPGGNLKGEIAYEVSKDVKGLTLSFADPLLDGQAVWSLE